MATSNISVSTTWTKIADDTDYDFTATWEDSRRLEVAVTSANTPPTVVGHLFSREKELVRSDVGAGFVWAQVAPNGLTIPITLVISKSSTGKVPPVTGSDGAVLALDSLAQTLTYNSDGTLNYIQVIQNGNTYRQTCSYTSGKLTGISAWVKQ